MKREQIISIDGEGDESRDGKIDLIAGILFADQCLECSVRQRPYKTFFHHMEM